MKQEDEMGFLSGKFDDWSGEPIPNGWNALESRLRFARIKRHTSVAVLGLLFFASLFSLEHDFFKPVPISNEISQVQNISGKRSEESTKESGMGKIRIQNEGGADNEKPAGARQIAEKMASANDGKTSRKIAVSGSLNLVNASAITDGHQIVNPKEVLAQSGAIIPSERIGSHSPLHNPVIELVREELVLPIVLKTPVFASFQTEYPVAMKVMSNSEDVLKKNRPGFSKSFTLQGAYAVSNIQFNHGKSDGWMYGVSNAQFTKAGYASAGLRMEQNFNRNFSVFYGLESGVWYRRMDLASKSKTPDAYQLVQTGENQFSVLPELRTQNETRSSLLVFAKTELGFRKAITPNFGLLAAAQIWGRLTQKSWSDLNVAAAFHTSSRSIAPGYRVGIWMQTGLFTQAELSFASMPENLAPATSGIDFNTRTINLGLRQYF